MANAPTNVNKREDFRGSGPGQFPHETKPRGAEGTGTIDRIKDTASELTDKAKETASNLTDRAKDMTDRAKDMAKDAASTVTDKAKEMAHYVGEKADDATTAVGSGMQSLAGGVERASSKVADKLESGGRYLQEHDLRGIAEDVGNLIRRNPWPSLLIALGVGFLVARAASSRS